MAKNLNSIRIATLNVHFFRDLHGISNAERLGEILQPLALDVLAVQEAYHKELPDEKVKTDRYYLNYLSTLLQLPHRAFCSTNNDFGNGLLSKFPLLSTSNHHVDQILIYNRRGMLEAKIDHPFFHENRAKLFVTHLDQIKESIRMKQWDTFEANLQNSSSTVQLLMGDFNALTRDDYSDDYFEKFICDVRSRNNWEMPQDIFTRRLKNSGFIDCWREMNENLKDEQTVTCAYGTRIDYIWRRGTLTDGWKIKECFKFSSNDATDHNGILLMLIKE